MIINICARNEVQQFKSQGVTDIISIGDPKQDWPILKDFVTPFSIHRFEFDDMTEVNYDEAAKKDNRVLPTEKHVKDLIDCYNYILNKGSGKSSVLFHCWAGVSRSSAAMFIFCVMASLLTYEESYNFTVNIRKFPIHPNALMIKHADNILKKDGKMLDFIITKLSSDYTNYVKKYGYTFVHP